VPTLDEYMARYDHEHTRRWNKVLHGVGIPIILAGIILLLLAHWGVGLALFVAGWAMLFLGHRIEGNHPAFFQGPVYFLVGPLWVAKEIKESLFGRTRRPQVSPPR
jgi:uncharacterized membrane protein YGL010W